MNKLFWFRVCIVFVVAVLNACANESENHWPSIHPLTYKVHVTSDNPKVSTNIFSEINPSEKLYALRCNKNDGVDDEDDGLNFYGMFQCYLIQLKPASGDLLHGSEHWAFGKDYNTRGVFTYEQLMGPCKDNPEFGLNRVFNLRGMKLELNVSDFKAPVMVDMLSEKVPPSFSFEFEVKVTQNITAISEATTPPANDYCDGYYEVDSSGNAIYHERHL